MASIGCSDQLFEDCISDSGYISKLVEYQEIIQTIGEKGPQSFYSIGKNTGIPVDDVMIRVSVLEKTGILKEIKKEEEGKKTPTGRYSLTGKAKEDFRWAKDKMI